MLPLHQCFHSSDSGLPVCLQPCQDRLAQGEPSSHQDCSLSLLSLVSAQLHFNLVKYST